MQHSTLAKRTRLFFFLAAFITYFYGLGRLPLIGPDEPRYVQVAREMFMRGDPITPTLGGHTWFEKPVLLYWMIMASFGAFGVSEWAARLGPACSGLLCVLIVYRIGKRVERASKEESRGGLALWSSATLASSAGLIVFSRAASFDIIVTMTMTAALACFFISDLTVDEKRRRRLLAGFYACVGASLLAKGLIGIVIPFGVVILYFALQRRWHDKVASATLSWGIPLALAVAATWYAPVIARHGWAFIDEFFIQHHFARYLSNKYHHAQPFYFYIPIMALLALPWSAFLAMALAGASGWDWRALSAVDKLRVFAFAWLVAPVVFFSFSGSKLPGYVLPALPGAALLVGEQVVGFLRRDENRVAMRATGGLLVLLALTGLLYSEHTRTVPVASALLVVAPAAVAGVFALIWARLRWLCLSLTVGAMFAGVALGINLAAYQVARRESVRDLLGLAAARGYASSPVFDLHTVERSSEFYAADRIARGSDGEPLKFEGVGQIADAARRKGGAILVIVPVEFVGQLTGDAAIKTEVIGDNGAVALVAVLPRQ